MIVNGTKGTMNILDIEKAKKILEEETYDEAEAGLLEDWGNMSADITLEEIQKGENFSGLQSYWATPAIRLIREMDGWTCEKEIECYTVVPAVYNGGWAIVGEE